MKEDNLNNLLQQSRPAHHYPGLEQLICAALADAVLATHLVQDPATTLQQARHIVRLTPEEVQLATAVVGAIDIYDFAAQLHAITQQHSHRNLMSKPYERCSSLCIKASDLHDTGCRIQIQEVYAINKGDHDAVRTGCSFAHYDC